MSMISGLVTLTERKILLEIKSSFRRQRQCQYHMKNSYRVVGSQVLKDDILKHTYIQDLTYDIASCLLAHTFCCVRII